MPLPPEKRARVIIDTDAKNEADDQFCIVQALLTPSFELHGIIPAHFGTKKSLHAMQDSHDEVMKLLDLMNLTGEVTVADGTEKAIPDESTPAPSAGAELIVREAMKDDPRPLHVAFLGPLTDMASTLLTEPRIAERTAWIMSGSSGSVAVNGRSAAASSTSPTTSARRMSCSGRSSSSGRFRCRSTG